MLHHVFVYPVVVAIPPTHLTDSAEYGVKKEYQLAQSVSEDNNLRSLRFAPVCRLFSVSLFLYLSSSLSFSLSVLLSRSRTGVSLAPSCHMLIPYTELPSTWSVRRQTRQALALALTR